MAYNELTKESFTDLFLDNFQLTHYAIKIVQQQIQGGNHDLNVMQILNEIRKHPPPKIGVEQEKE